MKRTKIYLMGNFPHLYMVKIGISKHVSMRQSEVNKGARGRVFVYFSLSVPYARKVEGLIHNLCSPLNIRWTGSGKTEWFFFLSVLIAVPIMLLAAVFELVVLALLTYLAYKFLFL